MYCCAPPPSPTHTYKQFSERSVSMTAIDMLTLLTEVAPQMLSVFPAMPAHILEGLCYSITVFMTDPELEKAPWVSKVRIERERGRGRERGREREGGREGERGVCVSVCRPLVSGGGDSADVPARLADGTATATDGEGLPHISHRTTRDF